MNHIGDVLIVVILFPFPHTDYGKGHSNRYIFSGKIKCGECGASFVSRKRKRKDGSVYRRWGCFTAANEGRVHTDVQGNVVGCDIGKQIRDELAMDMLRQSLRTIRMDKKQIINNITAIAMDAVGHSNNESFDSLKGDIRKQVTDMAEGLTESEVFYKNVLDQMVVYPNQRVELKLNFLPQKWIFVLGKRSNLS